METTSCAGRILKIRHSIGRALDVEYSTFDCAANRIEKIRSNNEANRIEFATFDPTKCTRLNSINPCRNHQTWPRPVMKHTARSGPTLAWTVPVTARLCPEQPDLAPVGSCVSSLIFDSWPGPGQGHSKISAWEVH